MMGVKNLFHRILMPILDGDFKYIDLDININFNLQRRSLIIEYLYPNVYSFALSIMEKSLPFLHYSAYRWESCFIVDYLWKFEILMWNQDIQKGSRMEILYSTKKFYTASRAMVSLSILEELRVAVNSWVRRHFCKFQMKNCFLLSHKSK